MKLIPEQDKKLAKDFLYNTYMYSFHKTLYIMRQLMSDPIYLI